MEEQFDLSEVVSDATKAQADRDFYLAMATQSKAVSPIAAYLAGAAGAKAASMTGKLQAQKDAQTAADKFTKRRDDLVFNMHAVARDKNINPATKAGMIGLIAREIGLQPKDYDAENNVLNVSDPKGNMMTFDFNEQLDEKGQAAIDKLNAQIKTEGAKQEKLRAEAEKTRSIASGSGKGDKYIKMSSFRSDPRWKNSLTIDEVDWLEPDVKQALFFTMRDLLNPKERDASYGDVFEKLQQEFGGTFGNKEPQSTVEEKEDITYAF